MFINISRVVFHIAVIIVTIGALSCQSEQTIRSSSDKDKVTKIVNITEINQQSTTDKFTAFPGVGIGNAIVNIPVEEEIRRLGKPISDTNFNPDSGTCSDRLIQWYIKSVDSQEEGYLLKGFAKDNIILQLSVESSSNIKTVENVGIGNTPEEVEQKYKSLDSFVDLSHTLPNQETYLTYWVDDVQGIAFEFYFDKKKRKRLVSGLYLFIPNSKFHPFLCSTPNEFWKSLEKFKVEYP